MGRDTKTRQQRRCCSKRYIAFHVSSAQVQQHAWGGVRTAFWMTTSSFHVAKSSIQACSIASDGGSGLCGTRSPAPRAAWCKPGKQVYTLTAQLYDDSLWKHCDDQLESHGFFLFL